MTADDSVVEQFCCAACGARLRFVKALTPGRRVWCPTCRAPLVLAPAPPAAPPPEPPAPAAAPAPPEEPPPRPRPRRPRPKPISRLRALAVGLAVAGGFLLLIGAAVVVMALGGVFDGGRR